MGTMALVVVEGLREVPMAMKLLKTTGFGAFDESQVIVTGGCDPFWKKAPKYNRAAKVYGYVLGLTDLDRHPCPAALTEEKLCEPLHPNFLLRIQVRAIESWLLADEEAWVKCLRVAPKHVPRAPDDLADPKRELMNLLRKSRRAEIQRDVVLEPGRIGEKGPGISPSVREFISEHWDADRAAQRSPSLARALRALRQAAANAAGREG